MNFCFYCDKNFTNLKRHIIDSHKPLSDIKNKGNIFCKICNVKVNNYYKHTFSKLHRFNQDLNSIIFFYNADDFLKHFNQIKNEKEIEDIIKLNKENIFWTTAKEELSEEDYKKLKESTSGGRKNIINYSRHSRFKRFSRASKGK